MSRHALVKDGAIIEYRDYAPLDDQSKLAPGKPRMLPVVAVNADFDPVTQVRTGPAIVIESNQVSQVYTVRNKNAGEIAAMKASKVAAVKREAERRILAVMPEWRQRNFLALGVEMITTYGADPKGWPEDMQALYAKAKEQWDQIKVLRARSDTKEAAVAALSGPVKIDTFDPAAGWE